jgi:hypothetical protein
MKARTIASRIGLQTMWGKLSFGAGALGLLAIVCLLWGGRRFPRGTDRRTLIAVDEFACAAAPLILFALMWLLAGSTRSSNARVRSGRATDAITLVRT